MPRKFGGGTVIDTPPARMARLERIQCRCCHLLATRTLSVSAPSQRWADGEGALLANAAQAPSGVPATDRSPSGPSAEKQGCLAALSERALL